MKVVFLDTTMDGSLIGGAHTFLHKILKELHDRGIEVHFITKGTPTAKTALNIEKSGAIIHNKLWPSASLTEDAAPVLADWLNKLNPDIYVVSVSPDIGWVVLPYIKPEIATLAIGHNDSDTFYNPAKHYSSFLTKAIGVSGEICRKYISKSGIEDENVVWIPYGVESSGEEPVKRKERRPISLIYVGRLEDEQKRVSDLIKIIHLLEEKRIDYTFRIIGDGILFEKLGEKLAKEISKGVVHLMGWLESNELMNYLRLSDIYVLTSAYEGFCISLIEAMANGCCPVVTDIDSGNKQLVIDNQNGFIVPVGDIASFVEKIEFLASNSDILLTMRQEAWKVGKSYSVTRMVDTYINCFIDAKNQAKNNPRNMNPSFPIMESCRSKYPLWMRRIKKLIKE